MNISLSHLTAKKYCSNFRLSIHIYVQYVPFILYITSRIYNNVIIILMTFTHVHNYVCAYLCVYICTYYMYVCMYVCILYL